MGIGKYLNAIKELETLTYIGHIEKVIGLTVESKGPYAEIGEICHIHTRKNNSHIIAEVIGFNKGRVVLMPLGDLSGIGIGAKVTATNTFLKVPVSENMIGRILDGMGKAIDGDEEIIPEEYYRADSEPPDPLKRKRIMNKFALGVKAIDGLLTCGEGQRIGIFSGSGVGKSMLLCMIARNSDADVNVIALIGERGREVREFIERDLGEEGMKKSVVVVATSDKPALVRSNAALTATAIAEYFRDKNKKVLLMMDSLTRFAMAQREIGMAVGEPPVSRGYTPSVFAVLPKLLERTGNSDISSITAIYTVLVEGDDMNEPIADATRAILDGHIVLDRKIAAKTHYPAIDILKSVSRIMPDIISKNHLQNSMDIKEMMSEYQQIEDMINIGAYKKGTNSKIDRAVSKKESIKNFLIQDIDERVSLEETLERLGEIVK